MTKRPQKNNTQILQRFLLKNEIEKHEGNIEQHRTRVTRKGKQFMLLIHVTNFQGRTEAHKLGNQLNAGLRECPESRQPCFGS